MAATSIFLAVVVIVPVMMNLVCLLVLARRLCKRWRQGSQLRETATLPQIKADLECPQAQEIIHMIILQPDQQVVLGKRLVLGPSTQEQQDHETAESLEKAMLQGNEANPFTFWVSSLLRAQGAAISADLR